MKIQQGQHEYELPRDLRQKLERFQQRVWSIKTLEALGVALAVLVGSYLLVFMLDRLGETPATLRGGLLAVGLVACVGYLPWKLYQWVWSLRQLAPLARLLAKDQPRVGDRLLGVIELAEARGDQHASPALCRAAIQQVADDTRDVDFLRSVPAPRHRRWLAVAGGAALLALAALLVPGAGWNALQRWARPWASIPRYTFTQLVSLPDRQVVPIGEPFEFTVQLTDGSPWQPARGSVRYGSQPRLHAEQTAHEKSAGTYQFTVPAQTEASTLHVAIGDARHTIHIEPKPRPELTALVAKIQLPDYLQAAAPLERDARNGVVSAVRGSRAQFQATASRELAKASVNGRPDEVRVQGAQLESDAIAIDEEQPQELQWTDVEGLSAKSPFRLRIRAVDDRAPSVQTARLAGEQVLLDEQVLAFDVESSDDFGIRSVGVEWSGIEDPRRNPQPPKGEYLLAQGAPDKAALSIKGDFSAKRLGIEPQPIHLRIFVEDYLPGRPRVYSPVYRLYVLNREQHLIWITEQLEQWERQALEVRDQESRLLEANKELAQLPQEEWNKEATRQRLSRQAAAERANAQRLASISTAGEQLINEAARNPEFNADTLENWAQMLQVLKQLSQKSMPSVAEHLNQAANAPAATPGSSAPKVSSGNSSAKPGQPGSGAPSKAPSVSDSVRGAETDPQKQNAQQAASPPSPSKGGGSLQLPTTTLPGPPSAGGGGSPSASNSAQAAVEEQEQLLAEFNRVMGEMAKILQGLQGSTFVKRLKAAADAELALASNLHQGLSSQFGEETVQLKEDDSRRLEQLQMKQVETTNDVRLIQDDLKAYFERTQKPNFQQVHNEMKDTEVVSEFKQMANDVTTNLAGEVVAHAEFWSDKLDRWAEILVGPPGQSGSQCKGGKGDSLPPQVVLEVLRILKAEVELRDSTRVVEQQRPVRKEAEHADAAATLKSTQEQLVHRTKSVVDTLLDIQTREGKNYGEALQRLEKARTAMSDATELLAATESGGPTIAAETEAIEALLITKRGKSGGGGGGGNAPGGGQGRGAADDVSALAGLGEASTTEAREVMQATGQERGQIPEEFRAGMDAYFSQIEGQEGG